jgi:CRP-like cAMP-binding protein
MAVSEQQAGLLRQHYLFSSLPPTAFESIAGACSVARYGDGAMVFAQGDHADAFYLVLSGAVELYALSADGHKKTIEVLQPGQSFAEALTFMHPSLYPVTAAAIGTVDLLRIPIPVYRSGLESDVEACFRLIGRLCQHLHSRVLDLEYQTIHSARERLVLLLLSRLPDTIDAQPVLELGVPRQVIASRIGVQPETLSRLLRQMMDEGIIEVSGRCIRILDLQRLNAELTEVH